MKRNLSVSLSKLVLGVFAVAYSPIALAATASDVQGYLRLGLLFINNIIIPLLFSIALLFFLINTVRYFIIGGAEIYRLALQNMSQNTSQNTSLCTHIYLTCVHTTVHGDAFLEFDNKIWQETERKHVEADEKNVFAMDFVGFFGKIMV